MIKKHLVKSCCGGSKSYIYEITRAISKGDLPAFHKAGFSSPPHFEKSGLFYVAKPNIVANGSFGATKIQVRATGPNANHLLEVFEKILDDLTSAVSK